jgi:hypothetical protein
MKPKLQHKKGSLVKLPNKTTHPVRLNLSERELLSKLVVEAKANASAGNPPQEILKPKSKEAVVADDPFSSLLRDLTKMLEPAEITKREGRLMRKMINNCIQRTLMELFAEIRDTQLTDVHEHATETNEPPQAETPEVGEEHQQPAQMTEDAAAFVAEINARNEIRDLLGSYFARDSRVLVLDRNNPHNPTQSLWTISWSRQRRADGLSPCCTRKTVWLGC